MKLINLLVEESQVKQPKSLGFIEKPLSETAHILGASSVPTLEVINNTGQWTDIDIEIEIQKVLSGEDSFFCVIFSTNNCHEIIYKLRYSNEINFSEVFGGIGCGVYRNRGTSYENYFEFFRKNFCAFEDEMPFDIIKNLDELYSTKISSDLKSVVKIRGEAYEIKYQFLKSNTTDTLKNALTISPIVAAVEGSYVFSNGKIINAGGSYCHSILIIGYKENDYWLVMDSETKQVLKFDWNYKFSSPSVHSFKKLNMPELYRKKGEKAIYFFNPDDGQLSPYQDGVISGGSMFKATGLLYSMATVVDELPYPIADYVMTTVRINNGDAKVENKVEEVKNNTNSSNLNFMEKLNALIKKFVLKNHKLGSSANPEELSLTIKGILLGIIPIVITLLSGKYPSLTADDLTNFVNLGFTALASITTLIGAGRKIYYSLK